MGLHGSVDGGGGDDVGGDGSGGGDGVDDGGDGGGDGLVAAVTVVAAWCVWFDFCLCRCS